MTNFLNATGLWAMAMVCGMCLILGHAASGQQKPVTGTVFGSDKMPVPYATVKISGADGVIAAYTTAGADGHFKITLPGSGGDYRLEVTAVGFKTLVVPFNELRDGRQYTLTKSLQQLEDVEIKSSRPMARMRGDTTNYKVSDFAGAGDRVIGDVLKKMPGIEIDDKGGIKYNGKSISSVLLDGDNLLDDKYGIATKTIPNAAVDKVQVLENHQPVKMLQNKVHSDDVALNLTIKDNARTKIIGKAQLGAGLPHQYDEDVNAIALKRKHKGINYLKANNTGTNLGDDLMAFNFKSSPDDNVPLLGIGNVGNPALSTNRYLRNGGVLVTANDLVHLKNETQLKVNASYLYDRQLQDYTRVQENYLPGDTIRYFEAQNNKYRPELWRFEANVLQNTAGRYINNTLDVDYTTNNYNAALNANESRLYQVMTQRPFKLSNNFNGMVKAGGSRIINLDSYISITRQLEQRELTPNYNAGVFNHGISYKSLNQLADVMGFYTRETAGMSFNVGTFTLGAQAGFTFQHQRLTSNMATINDLGTPGPGLDSAVNNLRWNKTTGFAGLTLAKNTEVLKLNVNLPLQLEHIRYTDPGYLLDKNTLRLRVQPSFAVTYYTRPQQYIFIRGGLGESNLQLSDVYRGYILTTYRSIMANTAEALNAYAGNVNAGYTYANARRLFSFGVQAGMTYQHADQLATSLITRDFSRRVMIPLPNSMKTYSLGANASKYVFALRTTFTVNTSGRQAQGTEIVNAVTLPYINTLWQVAGGAESKLTGAMTLSYKVTMATNKGRTKNIAGKSVYRQVKHNLAWKYNLTDDLLLGVSADNYFTLNRANKTRTNYSFADATVRYKLLKGRVEAELQLLNALNTRSFTTMQLSANVFTESRFVLPGRQLLGKMTFNF